MSPRMLDLLTINLGPLPGCAQVCPVAYHQTLFLPRVQLAVGEGQTRDSTRKTPTADVHRLSVTPVRWIMTTYVVLSYVFVIRRHL